MKRAFVALVGVHMLAELVDDERLRAALEGLPDLPQWREVRQVIEREIRRREQRAAEAVLVVESDSEDAA